MSEAIHTEQYKGQTIKIFTDEDAQNPRDDDNLGTMVCFHRRYTLGDKHDMTVEEAKKLLARKDVVSLPLYLYDHGGITMRTSGFSCPWDSGQVGFIFITHKRIKEEMARPGKMSKDGINPILKPIKVVTAKDRAHAIECLKGEVETYDNYLTGNVYGYVVEDEHGKELDSVWGYFGDYNGEYGAVKAAQEYIDAITHEGTTDSEGQELMEFAKA